MNPSKCAAIKAKYSDLPEPHLIPIAEFFDGNDDIGSLGCNLLKHPGIDAFRKIFLALLDRNDIEAIYAHISELDPGDDSWPFADTLYFLGTIPEGELESIVKPLEPDEIGDAADYGAPPSITSPALAIWWD